MESIECLQVRAQPYEAIDCILRHFGIPLQIFSKVAEKNIQVIWGMLAVHGSEA